MHFDLTDLRLFVSTGEEGSLTRAAARQHLSLAAASARIKSLETQSGMPLLYRETRGVRLTPAGEAFLHHARSILGQTDRLKVDLHEYSGGLRGQVRVFANTTAVTDFLPEILASFLAGNPQVSVDLQERPNPEIARGVLDGRVDIGIVAGPVDTLGLRRIHFSTDRLVLATSRRHRFARRKRISFAETLDEDAVGMHAGSTLQAFLAQLAERLGKSLRLRIQLSSFDAMCRMISTGVGVGIVPESAVRRYRDSMHLALIDLVDDWAVRDRYILVRDQAKLPRYAEALIDTLVRHYDGASADAHPPARSR